MDVLIKNVIERNYAEFKAAAARRNMRLGEASSEAFATWALKSHEDKSAAMNALRHMRLMRQRYRNLNLAATVRKARDER